MNLTYILERIRPAIETVGNTELAPETVEMTATAMQDILAELIAWQIDAGSERDAVNESEALHAALMEELKGWATPFDAPDDQAHYNH